MLVSWWPTGGESLHGLNPGAGAALVRALLLSHWGWCTAALTLLVHSGLSWCAAPVVGGAPDNLMLRYLVTL